MIRVPEVRVIGPDGQQKGILSVSRALELAREEGLDLVEVAPNEKPPVCRVMDYGKYKYKQSKKLQEAKKKQKTLQIKEIKMGPKTDEHDYQFKLKHARRFLSEGNKTKINILFKGRELDHIHLGKNILDRLAQELSDVASVEQASKLEGRNLTIVLAPKH
ncbi:MAG: translation initiation factor IF-3 [Nitrospinae bacterium RIFCSPLOWO2_12_FULL_45_22]|nr:MAG: translation initiation factor IF-3 [Nitrospinae bacterium RIFCSPLOWO2_12_FULL_45_22]